MSLTNKLSLLESFLNSGKFNVYTFERNKKFHDLKLEEIISHTSLKDVKFPNYISKTLEEINGLKIEWELKDEIELKHLDPNFPELGIFGRIHILDPSEMIGMYEMGMWTDTLNHHAEKHVDERINCLIPFDHYFPDYSGVACLQIKDNVCLDTVVFHNKQFGFYWSEVTFTDYLEYVFKYAGIDYCRNALIFPDSVEKDNLTHYWPQLV